MAGKEEIGPEREGEIHKSVVRGIRESGRRKRKIKFIYSRNTRVYIKKTEAKFRND